MMGTALVQQLCSAAGINAEQTWGNADVLIKQPVALSGTEAVFDLSGTNSSSYVFVWVLYGANGSNTYAYVGSRTVAKNSAVSLNALAPVRYVQTNSSSSSFTSSTNESLAKTNFALDPSANTVTISASQLAEATGAILVVISLAK